MFGSRGAPLLLVRRRQSQRRTLQLLRRACAAPELMHDVAPAFSGQAEPPANGMGAISPAALLQSAAASAMLRASLSDARDTLPKARPATAA